MAEEAGSGDKHGWHSPSLLLGEEPCLLIFLCGMQRTTGLEILRMVIWSQLLDPANFSCVHWTCMYVHV